MAKSGAKGSASRVAVWIILGLLIVALAGFGATSFTGSGSAVARVGDAEVTVDRYARTLQQELRALQAQAGRAIPLSEARAFGLDQQVLGRLVGDAALDHQASQTGVSVGDERIAEQIRSNPAFVGLDGSFDRESYRFTLEQNGFTIASYEELVRSDLTRGLIQAGLLLGIETPEAYADALVGYLREERDVTFAVLGPDDLEAPVPEPTEAELALYHSENAEAFTLGETKLLTTLALTPEILLDTIEIDEATLRDIYEERLDEYVTPERRLVERLVFADEAAASAARAAIEAGETSFEALVRERGLDLGDVDLGDVVAGDLGEAGAAVFALDAPGIAGPVPTPLGPALFRVNAILPASTVTFEDAEAELRDGLAAERARRIIADRIGVYEDLLAGGATLEEIAGETEAEIGVLEWRPEVSEGLAAYPGVRAAAEAVQPGDFPELIELEDGGIAAIRLDETRAPALQPLDEVREAVAEAWRLQETSVRVASLAREIAAPLEGGARLEDRPVDLRTETGLVRDSFVPDVPPVFVSTVFEMAPGDLRVIEGPGQAAIVRLDAVRGPDADNPETAAMAGEIGEAVSQSMALDLLNAFVTAARDEAGVTVDQSAINAVHAQFP